MSSAVSAGLALPRRIGQSVVGRIEDLFLSEQERWILWLPVLVGLGMAVYFALPDEPARWVGPVLAVAGALAVVAGLRTEETRPSARALVLAAVAIALGFAAVQIKAILLDTALLDKRLGPTTVAGRVTKIEPFPDGQRVIMDRVSLPDLVEEEILDLIRLRLRGTQPVIQPGDEIRLRAVLSPPPPPSAPGAYDFQRQAYFDGLAAVGFSVGTATVLPPASGEAEGGLSLWFSRLRFIVSERVRAHLDGASGAVTLALLTGEQRAIPEPAMASIRDSGLAHLLSISGLHIGLVAGIVLLTVRAALALLPALALRYPIKKWAAVASVLAAGAYMLLAGAPVPSQRSFLMIAVVLLAVLVDRQGLSMRLIAFAALFILLTQPGSMLGPSFQMSFAAVAALIATYELILRWQKPRNEQLSIGGRALLYLAGVVLSTLVAGIATAPYAAYHFSRFQVYGVAANMLAVPVTGFWIMPWAVVAMVLMPLGLEGLGLIPMSWGVDVVLWIAREVASWPGAVVLLPPMPTLSLVLITLGGLWLCLWQRRWRFFGLLGIAAGAAAMLTVEIPDLMVDASGRLLAVRSDGGGLLLSSRTIGRSTRQAWLYRAGEEEPYEAWPKQGVSSDGRLRCDSLGCIYHVNGRVAALIRRGEALLEDCHFADVVVSLVPVRQPCPSATAIVDRFDLWRDGAHALWIGPHGVQRESVNGARGNRPWVIRARPRHPPGSENDARKADAASAPAAVVSSAESDR